MQTNPVYLAFNRGRMSRLGMSRVDLKRYGLAAQIQTNWIPRVLGSMMLRPGMQFLDTTRSNAFAKFLPFIFSTSDVADIELTDYIMRIWVNDAVIARGAVSSVITNGTFDTNLTGWTDSDESGGTSAWVTGGYMGLTGNGTAAAIRDQQVTVGVADQNDEHALRITITRGPVTLRVGSTSGGDEYIAETTLGTGVHSLAFTPTGDFYIRLMSRLNRQVLVNSIAVESSGDVEIPAPWASADLRKIRIDQSGDVIYAACVGYRQRRIERRSTRSWSIVEYLPENGPFRIENAGPTTITPSAISGNITLAASAPLWRSTNVGSLFRLTSEGQRVEVEVTAEDTFSDPIRVTGVDSSRVFTIVRSGLSGTLTDVTLQRSLEDSTGPWEDVATYTDDAAVTYDDTLDNQVAWYRIGVKAGDYVAGTIDLSLDYAIGSITGVVRITSFSNSQSVTAEVLDALGGTNATAVWAEGAWSDRRGFPTALRIYEGRLYHFGKNGVWGSYPDQFENFDPDVEGDSVPINRTIGSGPVDNVNWGLGLQRLMIGAEGAEISVRSSSFDEPLTNANFNAKDASTQGSAAVAALKIDDRGVFVQVGGIAVYLITWQGDKGDYGSEDLTKLIPEIGEPGIVHIAVQRKPDTRIHCVRSDGTVGMLVMDTAENVLCWVDVETDGDVEDILIMPGTVEDRVKYVVKRETDSGTVRYFEKWALESQCRGGTTKFEGASTTSITGLEYPDNTAVTVRDGDGNFVQNATVSAGSITLSAAATYAEITPALYRLADSFITYDGTATTTITGLDHLEGLDVIVWGDGRDQSPGWGTTQTRYTVTGGQITLTTAVRKAIIGLPYEARWKSTKLVNGVPQALNKRSKITQFGLNLVDTHRFGVRYGSDLNDDNAMDDLPGEEAGETVDAHYIWTEYAQDMMEFPGGWSPDSRLCLLAQAPRPATVSAAIIEGEMHGKR